jgi:hypothetical protein
LSVGASVRPLERAGNHAIADRKGRQPRPPDAPRGGEPRIVDPARVIEDATDRVPDQSGRLAGEESSDHRPYSVAHWIATYSELLSFKRELLAITARRRISLPEVARGEAEADEVLISAQAEK